MLALHAQGQESTTERNFHLQARAHPKSAPPSSHREQCSAVPALEIHVARNLEQPHLHHLESPQGGFGLFWMFLECFGMSWNDKG